MAMPCDGAGGPLGTCLSAAISDSLISLIFACVAKSTTANPLRSPSWAKIHLVDPSGFFDIAIGEGAGVISRLQAISLVLVSITSIMFAGGLAPLLDPATRYLPSGVTLRSWTPPLSAMDLTFSN